MKVREIEESTGVLAARIYGIFKKSKHCIFNSNLEVERLQKRVLFLMNDDHERLTEPLHNRIDLKKMPAYPYFILSSFCQHPSMPF